MSKVLTEDSADMRINQKQNIESHKLRTERNLKVYLKKNIKSLSKPSLSVYEWVKYVPEMLYGSISLS